MKLQLLMLAGAAAMVPAVIGPGPADAAVRPAGEQFIPPSGPLTMTRMLVRTLADGKQVVVTRRYLIRFTREGGGYRLDGEQVGAEVSAPPALAGLAEIERKRVEHGLFPARLDAQGMVLPGGAAQDPAASRAALTQGEQIIVAAPLPAPAKRERRALLGRVASAITPSAWPVFLFNPGPQDRIEQRKLTLAGGTEGEIEVRISVQGLMACGLPQVVERTVITRLSGTSRVSRERWTFALDPA